MSTSSICTVTPPKWLRPETPFASPLFRLCSACPPDSGLPSCASTTNTAPAETLTDAQQRLLERYVDAFERYDMAALSRLLHDDVIQSMPPYAMWLQGRDDVLAWWAGPGAACEGSKLLAGWANGCPAFAQYRVDPAGGHAPWAMQVLELRGDRVAEFHAFLDTEAFERFGFPAHL